MHAGRRAPIHFHAFELGCALETKITAERCAVHPREARALEGFRNPVELDLLDTRNRKIPLQRAPLGLKQPARGSWRDLAVADPNGIPRTRETFRFESL